MILFVTERFESSHREGRTFRVDYGDAVVDVDMVIATTEPYSLKLGHVSVLVSEVKSSLSMPSLRRDRTIDKRMHVEAKAYVTTEQADEIEKWMAGLPKEVE